MVRSLPTTFAAVVLAGAVLWGGCVPCQQLFARPEAATGCCDRAGKCKTPAPVAPSPKSCKSPALALEQFVKAEPELRLVAVAEGAPAVFPALAADAPVVRVAALPGYSPPDLFRLYSAFLI